MSNKTNRLCVLAAIAMLAFCVHAQTADDQVQVVSESDLKSFWLPDPAHDTLPQYPVEAITENVEGCVAVAFMIHNSGSVSNERIWRDTFPRFDSSPFFNARKTLSQNALFAVHQWRFVPAPDNKAHTPVYTYHIFIFTIGGPQQTPANQRHQDEVEAKCKMTDFPQQVQAMINSAQAGKKP